MSAKEVNELTEESVSNILLFIEHHDHYLNLLKSPEKRLRSITENEELARGQTHKGKIESFCLHKGHGFIKQENGSELIFVHVADIEGEWVPKEGDFVRYKQTLMPPKMEKYQAVHVRYIHLNECVNHEHWNAAFH